MSTQQGTLRLPPPPPPPKPLHLTMSLRGTSEAKKASSSRPMPTWSQDDATIRLGRPSEDPDDDNDSVISGREEWTTARSRMVGPTLEDLFRNEGGGGTEFDEPRWSRKARAKASQGSEPEQGTVRRRKSTSKSTLKGKPIRTSIFFDPLLPNPLIDPSPPPPPPPVPEIPPFVAPPLSTDETPPLLSPPALPEDSEESDSDEANVLDLPVSSPAVSLHSFTGESAFGELSFEGGVNLCIEVEDLGGGWSLGFVEQEGEESRGLIPRGWYACVDPPPTLSIPLSPAPPSTSSEPSTTSIDASIPVDVSPALLHLAISGATEIQLPLAISRTPPSPSTPLPSLPRLSPTSSPPSRALPSPPTTTSTLLAPSPRASSPNTPPESPSMIRSRSIGRNVVISGIEFEPTDSVPSTPSSHPGYQHQIQAARLLVFSSPMEKSCEVVDEEWFAAGSVAVGSPGPTTEEMLEFFSGVRSPARVDDLGIEDVFEGVGKEDGDGVQESGGGEEVESEDQAVVDSLRGPPDSWDQSMEEEHLDQEVDLKLSLASEDEGWAPPSPSSEAERSVLDAVAEADEEDEGDTQEARERRWTAFVEQADRADPGRPAGLDDFPTYASAADVDVKPPTPALLPPPSPPAAPTHRPSTFFDRFGVGLGTLGRGAPLGTASRSFSVKGKGVVESWILQGDLSNDTVAEESQTQTFHIESGPAWKDDTASFTVHVHSPEKRSSIGRADYTVFHLTTVFSSSSSDDPDDPVEPLETVNVERRYSHFSLLYAILVERYPVLVIPSLPAKSYAGRFQANFVETRRRDLERWCFRVGRHPVLRCSDHVRGFLALEDDKELRDLLLSTSSPTSAIDRLSFFAQVYHPEFNVHPSDAEETVDRFERHSKASEAGGGLLAVETSLGKVREGLRDTSINFYALAHNLARLVAGLALPPVTASELAEESAGATNTCEGGSEKDRRRALALGLQNADGAFTWKEGGEESLSTSKAVQATAEAIGAVAELYDSNARTSLLPVHELVRESSYPYSHHIGLIQTHRKALAQHAALNRETPTGEDNDILGSSAREEAIARCETVLNITSAEIERVHAERAQDLKTLAEQFLDGQMQFHEKALERLCFARSHFDPTSFSALAHTGPRLRSTLERSPPVLPPLSVPSTYGVPPFALGVSSSIGSPVGAVQEAVGSVLGLRGGGAGAAGSQSVVYAARGGATAGTFGRSAKEILDSQSGGGMGTGRAPTRATWRESFFGTGRLW